MCLESHVVSLLNIPLKYSLSSVPCSVFVICFPRWRGINVPTREGYTCFSYSIEQKTVGVCFIIMLIQFLELCSLLWEEQRMTWNITEMCLFKKNILGRAFFQQFGRIFELIEAERITRGNKMYKTEWEVKRKSTTSFLCGNEVNFQIN